VVSGGNGIMNVRLRKEESRHYFKQNVGGGDYRQDF